VDKIFICEIISAEFSIREIREIRGLYFHLSPVNFQFRGQDLSFTSGDF